MRKVIFALAFAALAAPAFAQKTSTNNVQLFQQSLIHKSPLVDSYFGGDIFQALPTDQLDGALPYVYSTASVEVSCQPGATAVLSSTPDGNGPIIVDNFFTVNDTLFTCGYSDNARQGCFAGWNPQAPNWYSPDVLGAPATNSYYLPLAPVNISSSLKPGIRTLTFSLKDAGGIYGNSALYIATNCTITKLPLCHKDKGTPGENLLLPQSAIAAHLKNHTDDCLGACTPDK